MKNEVSQLFNFISWSTLLRSRRFKGTWAFIGHENCSFGWYYCVVLFFIYNWIILKRNYCLILIIIVAPQILVSELLSWHFCAILLTMVCSCKGLPPIFAYAWSSVIKSSSCDSWNLECFPQWNWALPCFARNMNCHKVTKTRQVSIEYFIWNAFFWCQVLFSKYLRI